MDRKELTCIICPEGCFLKVELNADREILSLIGHKCQRGETYVRSEIMNPLRILTSLVRLEDGKTRMCPVRSSQAIPKEMLQEMALSVAKVSIKAPVYCGDIVVKNIMGTGADIIVTRDLE